MDHCVAKAAVFLMHGSSKVITNKCVHLFYFFLVCTYLSFWIKFYPIILESFKNSIYLTINSNFGLFCNFHYTWKHLMILDYVYYFVGSLRITVVISTYAYVSKMMILWYFLLIYVSTKRVANKNTEPNQTYIFSTYFAINR